MKDEFFEFAILLERALASFYEKIMKEERLERVKSTLEFQATHSHEHAKRIAETAQSHKKPQLGEKVILDYQNNLTRDLFDKISVESDINKIIETLADSEEKLGDLYKKIAEKMRALSAYYETIAGEIDTIGDEEYQHRDLLLMEKK